ncbi:MAG: hypothetical protein ACXVKA_04870 [Acidimicrobiia bacterium]
MRKFLVAAGLAGTLAALPVGSAVGASTGHVFKGKGTGTVTLDGGGQFTLDGTVKVKSVGPVAFHSTGTTSANGVTFTTTFTGSNGDTLTTSSVGSAKHTRLGKVFITTDTITGGTGRLANATGKGKTAAKVKLAAPDATTGTVKFVLAGRISF